MADLQGSAMVGRFFTTNGWIEVGVRTYDVDAVERGLTAPGHSSVRLIAYKKERL